MSKQIALFFDGTGNDENRDDAPTNVWKLYLSTELPETQKHYIKGVGDRWYKLGGVVGGYGSSEKIREGYKFLVENYEKGDKIYLFGFSRGAYITRSLSGFIDKVGLFLKKAMIVQNNHALIEKAFKVYEEKDEEKQKQALEQLKREYKGEFDNVLGFDKFDILNEDVENDVRHYLLPIYFIGVWDTVGSLGYPNIEQNFLRNYVSFHNTDLPRNVTRARHALSIHDLRLKPFEPILWTHMPWKNKNQWRNYDNEPQTLQQVWFPGIHADIGGGYPTHESGLAYNTLLWMATEALDSGLPVNQQEIIQINSPENAIIIHSAQAGVHETFEVAYKLTEIDWCHELTKYGVRNALFYDTYEPLGKPWNLKEKDDFWDTIFFHETTLIWIFDHLTRIKPYEFFFDDINTLSLEADQAVFKLIVFRVEDMLDGKSLSYGKVLFILRMAIYLKIHELNNGYKNVENFDITKKLDEIIERIICTYYHVIEENDLSGKIDTEQYELWKYILELEKIQAFDKYFKNVKKENKSTVNKEQSIVKQVDWLFIGDVKVKINKRGKAHS